MLDSDLFAQLAERFAPAFAAARAEIERHRKAGDTEAIRHAEARYNAITRDSAREYERLYALKHPETGRSDTGSSAH